MSTTQRPGGARGSTAVGALPSPGALPGEDGSATRPSAGPVRASRVSAGSIVGGLWRVVRPLVVSLVVAVALWYGFLKAFSINPLVGQTPQAVWRYLFTASSAAADRSTVLHPLGTTLRDAGLGFVAGLVAAVVVGVVFVLVRSLEQGLMPVAMLLRSVPLVAMTPLIGLVFGRSLVAVSVMGGIVVFFPALVNTVQGLRSVHSGTRDLVVAYGGSDLTVLRKVGVPSALPALFAAARISVPGALVGALVAEWLLTGQGLGGRILSDIGGFRYAELWAEIAALTAVSVVLYTLVGAVENLVLARYAPQREQR